MTFPTHPYTLFLMGTLLARVRGLSPLGPILGKELIVAARRKRTYLLRCLYLGCLLAILLFFHLAYRGQDSASVVQRAQQSAEMGGIFLAVFAYFTIFVMSALGPVLTCTSISSERLQKTLPVLLMTPITAWQIVCGKLLSRLLIALTLLGLSLPALAVVRLLGGIEIEQIAAALLISLATVLATAALGLFLSTLMDRSYTVILLSYGILMFLWIFLPMVLSMVFALQMQARGGPGSGMWLITVVCISNPFAAMAVALDPGGLGASMSVLMSWWWCAIAYGIAALILLALSGVLLRRAARRESGSGGAPLPLARPPLSPPQLLLPPPPLPAPAMQQAFDVPLPAAPPLPPPPPAVAPARQVGDNPVLWRELRRPLTSKRWQAIALTVIILSSLAILYVLMGSMGRFGGRSALSEYEPQMGFAVVFCGLLCLLASAVAGTAIAHEKETDTWTLLLATPLSARQIVLGKFGGLLRRLMWPAILIAAHFLLFTLIGAITWQTSVVILWLIFACNVIWLATGLYLSLRLKTVVYAVVVNFALVLAVYVGALIALGIAGELFHQRKSAELVGLYAPYYYLVTAIDWLNNTYSHSSSIWMPVLGTTDAPTFFMCIFVVGVAHLLLTALVIYGTICQFDRMVGRAHQASSPAVSQAMPA